MITYQEALEKIKLIHKLATIKIEENNFQELTETDKQTIEKHKNSPTVQRLLEHYNRERGCWTIGFKKEISTKVIAREISNQGRYA